MEPMVDRMENMLRDCKNKLSTLGPLGFGNSSYMAEFKNSRGFGTLW